MSTPVHELRHYVLLPGQREVFLDLFERVALPMRGGWPGRLLGFWSAATEVPELWHLWEYESLDARGAIRAAIATDEAWTERFLVPARPLVERQSVRFLWPQMPIASPGHGGARHELRHHACRAFRSPEVLSALQLPMTVGTTRLGLWSSEVPDPHEVIELFRHDAPPPPAQAPPFLDAVLATASHALRPTRFSPLT